MLPLVFLLAVAGDADLLGSDRWVVRERAERRLEAWGPMAWPTLLSRARDENAEVRTRATRLLTPYRVAVLEREAVEVLRGDRDVKPWEFYRNGQMRLRVHRLATAEGVPEYLLNPMHPDHNPWCTPWGLPVWWMCWESLREARNYYWRTAPPPHEK